MLIVDIYLNATPNANDVLLLNRTSLLVNQPLNDTIVAQLQQLASGNTTGNNAGTASGTTSGTTSGSA